MKILSTQRYERLIRDLDRAQADRDTAFRSRGEEAQDKRRLANELDSKNRALEMAVEDNVRLADRVKELESQQTELLLGAGWEGLKIIRTPEVPARVIPARPAHWEMERTGKK